MKAARPTRPQPVSRRSSSASRARARPAVRAPTATLCERGLPGHQRVLLEEIAGAAVEAGKRLRRRCRPARRGPKSPAAALSRVDFPQPVGPTMATNSPVRTASEMSRTALIKAAAAAEGRWRHRRQHRRGCLIRERFRACPLGREQRLAGERKRGQPRSPARFASGKRRSAPLSSGSCRRGPSP